MPLNTNIRITRSFFKQNRFICAINYDYLGEKKIKTGLTIMQLYIRK